MTKYVRRAGRSRLAWVLTAAIIAAAVACFWATGFAHYDGVGDEGGHHAHAALPAYLQPPGGLPGTSHDFSSLTTPLGEPGCIVCHDGPEWRHRPSTHTTDYTVYDNPDSTEVTPGRPGTSSLKCLDCHDGTVDYDSFWYNGAYTTGTAPLPITNPETDFGINLRHHHPVGMAYDGALPQFNPATGGTGANARGFPPEYLMGPGGTVECTTCHNPHSHYQEDNPTNEPGAHSDVHTWGSFVKVESLCFSCHQRYQDDVSTSQGVSRRVDPDGDGHHFPRRDDPLGIDRGTGVGGGELQFACFRCHDIDGTGALTPGGHNSPCVNCHITWDPWDPLQPSPEDAPATHHGTSAGLRWDPATYCAPCHTDSDPASPSYGLLVGDWHEGYFAPSCTLCHGDKGLGWSAPAPGSFGFAQNGGGKDLTLTPDAYTAVVGEPVSLKAAVRIKAIPRAGRNSVMFQWTFGDGTPAEFPAEITYQRDGWDGLIEATHTFDTPGLKHGSVAVTDGATTVYHEFTVNVAAEPTPGPDSWNVDEASTGVGTDFEITFTSVAGGVGGDFTAIKGSSSVAFGTESGGVIFWMDLVFTGGGWSVGNVYFGNIKRSAGTMDGVLITPAGVVDLFHGDAN